MKTRGMRITQSPIALRHILGENTFEIPLYQREFSWELEQVSDLFYDIDNSTANDGHFLGSLLLYANDEKSPKEVIDGQQRLTTLFLLLFTIKKAIANSGGAKAIETLNNLLYERSTSLLVEDTSDEPRLKTGKRDRKLFRALLKGEEISTHKQKIKSHKLLLDVLDNFLKEKIDKLLLDHGTLGLLAFTNKVIEAKFIVMTADREEDKILLFKTLNARGIELSQSDLIKNELCKNVKGISEDEAIDMWDDMREILEKGKANTDMFLYYYINSLHDSLDIRKAIEKKMNIERDKETYPPVPEKYLFQVYGEKLKSLSSTFEFLNDLKTCAETYVDINSPTSKDIYLYGIKVLNTTKCFPLLLRGKKVLTDKNFIALSKAIECISFRHAMLKSDPKDLEKFYYTALSKLKSDKDLDSIIAEIKSHPTMSSAIEYRFKNEFCSAARSVSISKMILGRIAAYHQESIDLESKDVWLEHIMPRTAKGEWKKLEKKDAELYKISVDRLGNLTLFQDKKNIGASNKDFNIKKPFYEASRIKITKEIAKNETWDWDTIDERQTSLYEIAKEIWKL
jgi:uncharacterized protein with ParB-like and HNH nuclease domain